MKKKIILLISVFVLVLSISMIGNAEDRFPFDNPPGLIEEKDFKSMRVGDTIYLRKGYECEATDNVEIKKDKYDSYSYTIKFLEEGNFKIKVFETENPTAEKTYDFIVHGAKEPYVEQLLPKKIKIGDTFDNLYIYYDCLLGTHEYGFEMSGLTWEEIKKYFMTGINWGGAYATDPETRKVEGYLPGGVTKPGVFKVAAERDTENPYLVTIEEPSIKSNLPETIKVGTEMDVTTSLENTSLINRKVEDVIKQLTRELEGGFQEGEPRYPIGYQPVIEIASGAELIERSNKDYTNILNTSETIKFIGEGTVKFKVTYDMHNLYKDILESDESFDYTAPNGYPIAIKEEAMYSPTAMFSVNIVSELPTEPENPTKPESPDSIMDDVINSINNTQEGKDVVVDMKSGTVVPKEVLEAAKGKNINLKLFMNGYSWTINGKDIEASNLLDINLEVKFNTNAVPSDIVKELAGENHTEQLSLTHNGNFGFKATLTHNVGKEYSGKYGNLYHYDSNGKMVFMNAGKIQENGNVSLTFSHASDYIIVMSDKNMEQADNQVENVETKDTIKTGDTASSMPYIIALVICTGICVFIVRKRYLVK